MFEIIPAIDILGGKVVRLTQGRYDQVDYYDYTPADLAKLYEENGATRIHLVDLDGARDGKLVNGDVFAEIRRSVKCSLELGGGIRSEQTAKTLFDLGITYIVLGSLLVKQPVLSEEIIRTFPDRVIAGIDAKNGMVATEGWLEESTVSAAKLAAHLSSWPLAGIIYTDIGRDGMMNGPNIEELKTVAAATSLPVIASGGIRSVMDISALKTHYDNGIQGCIIGKAILSGKIDLAKLWK